MNPGTKFSREQIHEGIVIDIADCLACEPEDVTPEGTFFTALAGESIELLDLSFRIQKRFGIRVRFPEIFQGLQFDALGRIAADSVQRLTAEYPQVDWEGRFAAMTTTDPRDLLTVGLIEELVFLSQTESDAEIENSKGQAVAGT